MAEAQLSVRSTKAREIAERLAERQQRTVAEIVERALERYEVSEGQREPAADFYARLKTDYATDVDLDAIIQENRQSHRSIDL